MHSKHFQFILFFAFLSGITASCHKDTGPTGPRLVKSMNIEGSSCQINCLYDDENRVTSVTQCDTVESYSYYDDSIVYVRTVGGGSPTRYIYAINDKGIATSGIKVASDGSVTNYTYTYDANNDRIQTTDNTNPNTFVTYTIENNNVVQDSSVSSLLGAGNYTISRIYYANTDNTIGYANFGKTFLGSSSANFKKAESYNTQAGQYTINYFYELDHLNGVSRRIMKTNDSIIESREYEYYGSD
ncbi:MAG: hypothetical protein JWO03_2503 [Bacteroidetes bacterium]|nr:hypothetical protein [Bacteroidota bacterium]